MFINFVSSILFMKKLIYAILSLLVIQVATATPVMLATDLNYADILVASAAANKIGAEVYWVNKETIPEEIYSAIENANPEEIYIIGGPAVVSEEIEANLSQKYNVIRIWGMTRYGTAAEVAKYFWKEGSEKAVLVRDEIGSIDKYAELVAKAKDIAVTQEIPLLLVPKNTLPAETEEALKELGVKEIYLVGEIEQSLKTMLKELGISIISEAKTLEEAENQAIVNAKRIIITAVGGWKDIITVTFAPKGVVLHIRNENQIPQLIEKLKEIMERYNIEEIKVVGRPTLAEKICNALAEQGIKHECITGKRAFVAKTIAEKFRKDLMKLRERYQKREIQKFREIASEKAEELKEKCEINYEKAKSVLHELNESAGLYSVAKARFELIKTLREECLKAVENRDYEKAYEFAYQLKHEVRMLIWDSRDLIEEDIKEEILSEVKSRNELRTRAFAIKSEIEKDLEKIFEELPMQCKEQLRIANKLLNEGEINKAIERLRIAKRVCEMAKTKKLKEIRKAEKEERICIQVITPAINPETGECIEFPTPCDVPEGWKIVGSCEIVKKAKRKAKECAELARKLEEMKERGASEEEIEKLLKELKEKCRRGWVPEKLPTPPVAEILPVKQEKPIICKPVCKAIGTRSEGWYDSCTGKLIKWAKCADCKVECTSQGWLIICGNSLEIIPGKCKEEQQKEREEKQPIPKDLILCPDKTPEICPQ
ncbi:MAG TPA: hypothetical protein EYH56_03950, partial [Nanoarchaeota archaeon]|nr:hypothetical protein [Nanoarchaeota archaeon]